jgi:hypothetical protein
MFFQNLFQHFYMNRPEGDDANLSGRLQICKQSWRNDLAFTQSPSNFLIAIPLSQVRLSL